MPQKQTPHNEPVSRAGEQHHDSPFETMILSGNTPPPGWCEKLPLDYQRKMKECAGDRDAETLAMLKCVAGEFLFGPKDVASRSQLAERAYRVARNIGDIQIHDTDAGAFTLLEGTRSMASFGALFGPIDDPEVLGVVSSVNQADNLGEYADYRINYGAFEPNSTSLLGIDMTLAENDVQINMNDLAFLHFLSIAAHEAGHMIQLGVGGAIGGDIPKIHRQSDAILKSLPSSNLARHKKTSWAVHTERFAQGYGQIVLAEAMRVYGFEPEQAAVIQSAINHYGAHSDLLLKLEDRSIPESDEPKKEHVYVGYMNPLSRLQIAQELRFVSDSLRNKVSSPSAELLAAFAPEIIRIVEEESTQAKGDVAPRTVGGSALQQTVNKTTRSVRTGRDHAPKHRR